MTLPPAAWLIVQDGTDERRYRWPRALALPRVGEMIRLDHGDQAEELVVTDLVHLLTVATGSHMPSIYAVPADP